jgi:hypothetical protein
MAFQVKKPSEAKQLSTSSDVQSRESKAREALLRMIQKTQKFYRDDKRQDTFNLLLLGEHGSGKTYLARTARKPVFIDSFDPGGTKCLKDLIETGKVISDTRWESEIPIKPFAFPQWLSAMEERKRVGLFDHIGTYVLDSCTSWSKAIMNNILKKAGIAGSAPRFTKDYTPQKVAIENSIYEMLDLPCDLIMTGHLEQYKDEGAGVIRYRFLTTGKGSIVIPTLFDEIWVMDPKDASDGVSYRILTQSTGTHVCRSRLAGPNKLAKYEKPNLKEILKKVGRPVEDLPLFEGGDDN